MTYELHPLCTLFPRLGDAEFAALVADIRANGLREPITLHDGMVLDGGNRYRACIEAGVEPVFTEYTGSSIVAFVLSANLHRRHLKEGQQAAIVASAQDWAKAQPAHRPEKAGNVAGLSTVAERAAQSGASERTQRMADKVARADPALAKQVAHGEVSLPKALARVEGRPAPAPAPEPAYPPPDEDLKEMLLDMQRECETYARRMADWERAMQADGKQALVMAIKRYEHAEREKALADERAGLFQRQRDDFAKRLKAVGRAIGEDDLDKVVRAVQTMVRKPVEQAE